MILLFCWKSGRYLLTVMLTELRKRGFPQRAMFDRRSYPKINWNCMCCIHLAMWNKDLKGQKTTSKTDCMGLLTRLVQQTQTLVLHYLCHFWGNKSFCSATFRNLFVPGKLVGYSHLPAPSLLPTPIICHLILDILSRTVESFKR